MFKRFIVVVCVVFLVPNLLAAQDTPETGGGAGGGAIAWAILNPVAGTTHTVTAATTELVANGTWPATVQKKFIRWTFPAGGGDPKINTFNGSVSGIWGATLFQTNLWVGEVIFIGEGEDDPTDLWPEGSYNLSIGKVNPVFSLTSDGNGGWVLAQTGVEYAVKASRDFSVTY